MIPIARNIKRYFSLKDAAIILMAVIFSVSAGVGVFLYLKKEVSINDNGAQYQVKTMKSTVKEVLDQNGIKVNNFDYINVPLDTVLHRIKENEIIIKRAVPVNILADGKEIKAMTYKDTVADVLKDNKVALSGSDRLEDLNFQDRIQKDMQIKVVRVNEQIVTEKFPVPFKVITTKNDRMDVGTERVAKEGKEGIQEKAYRVVLENGKEILRELIQDAVIQNPINKIIEIGTILNHTTARGDVLRYDKVMDMRATAYTSSFKDTGKNPGDKNFGITCTGIKAKRGVIAVDPKVIPLGTRVYVEVAGKTPDYGYAIAADVGGGIKNDLIDIYLDDQVSVDNWGVRKVKVYILKE